MHLTSINMQYNPSRIPSHRICPVRMHAHDTEVLMHQRPVPYYSFWAHQGQIELIWQSLGLINYCSWGDINHQDGRAASCDIKHTRHRTGASKMCHVGEPLSRQVNFETQMLDFIHWVTVYNSLPGVFHKRSSRMKTCTKWEEPSKSQTVWYVFLVWMENKITSLHAACYMHAYMKQ